MQCAKYNLLQNPLSTQIRLLLRSLVSGSLAPQQPVDAKELSKIFYMPAYLHARFTDILIKAELRPFQGNVILEKVMDPGVRMSSPLNHDIQLDRGPCHEKAISWQPPVGNGFFLSHRVPPSMFSYQKKFPRKKLASSRENGRSLTNFY